jgi:hypothetical protein
VVDYFNEMQPPSQAAKPPSFRAHQNSLFALRNGCPYDKTGRSIALHHKVFHDFQVTAAHTPSPEYLAKAPVFDFIKACRMIYEDEDERIEAISPLVKAMLGYRLIHEPITGCKGDKVVPGGGGYLLITEWKNEIGAGSSDPSIQSGFSYGRYWGQETVRSQSIRPAIH